MKHLIWIVLAWTSAAYADGSYALYDYQNDRYQADYNVSEVRPIASITKLFTAITVLRSGAELDELVKVQGQSRGHFPNGMMVSRINLMRAMLISSDNRAAETLAKTYPGGFVKFMTDEDEFVRGYGLLNTKLHDSTGLSVNNVSTINELVKFMWIIRNNEVIRSIANERHATIAVPKGRKSIKINLKNTNPTLFDFDNILISKTGFTNPAGRCVVMLVEKDRELYTVVILGQKNVQARSKLAQELMVVPSSPKLPVMKPIVESEPDIFELLFPFNY